MSNEPLAYGPVPKFCNPTPSEMLKVIQSRIVPEQSILGDRRLMEAIKETDDDLPRDNNRAGRT